MHAIIYLPLNTTNAMKSSVPIDCSFGNGLQEDCQLILFHLSVGFWG